MPQKHRFTLKLSSCPENINKVEPFLQQIRQRYNLSEELYFNMLLVLTEAINNSILHGNGADPCKNVMVKLRPSKAALSFTITDEGCGFNPDKLPDPTTPPCLLKPNGRGVFLMRKLSDYLQYSEDGTKVEIKFNIHS
ncbi:ATP-binding protein [Sphingobacteriales bacterium UPWRP_1]|nr:hypothetical protein BVG80_18345 [Sphingobacteriales bacterium TSM_CSM]PSJ73435.1 ATP-binding protein [Sphingobacteriales bacterium UPWRP_1]